MDVIVTCKDGQWLAECWELNLYGIGLTEEEALNDIQEHYTYYRKYYMKLPNSRLTEEARKLKERFIYNGEAISG